MTDDAVQQIKDALVESPLPNRQLQKRLANQAAHHSESQTTCHR